MRILARFCVLMLIVSPGLARNTETHAAEIQNVRVISDGDKLKVEVKLSGLVNPKVVVATNPDRLVLELPNTRTGGVRQHIPVNQDGVKGVRIGQDNSLSRLVLDLDHGRPYGLATDGDTIALTVLPMLPGNASVETPLPAASSSSKVSDPPTLIASAAGMDGIAGSGIPAALGVASKRTRMGFKVKYVAEGVVYLAGGRSLGLEEGMRLSVRESRRGATRFIAADDDTPVVAELQVVSVADSSAVTEVHGARRDIKPGDWAYLSAEQTEALAAKRAFHPILKERSQKESFSNGSNSQAETARARTSTIPEPESRIRARVGFDYSGLSASGSSIGSSSTVGFVARTDMTRIGGTHWNLNGYWRGRMTRRTRTGEDTLQDMLNKTYTMQLSYDNPDSNWVAGFGRLYLPWASSLDTIDGGYVGRRVASGMMVGAFAGSTPDPTSWHYNPDRRIGGTFVNFEGGNETFRYTSTAGVALNTIKWQLDRPFVFLENGVSFKNSVSVYHDLIVDAPQGLTTNGINPGAGISRSYLTLHLQPYRRISFDVYHNYFRDVPTASTALIGTGLVDKLLYQGVSFGVRVEPVRHFFLYTTLGQSSKTGDTHRTLNQMYGFTWDEIGRTGLRADFRYSKFASSFGQGDYKVLTLSRHLGDRMMWDAQFGAQNLVSSFTVNNSSKFVDTSLDMNLTDHTFFQSGYTVVRGAQLNYNQWYTSVGYRFDSKPVGK
jgi:AMIN domain